MEIAQDGILALVEAFVQAGFLLIDISFLNISLWDLLDIAIVAYLFYRIYLLLRGSIAFNIFTGLLMLYGIWWLVNALNMQLLSTILSQFVSVGVILLIIIFQPEIRKFLLELGKSTFGGRFDLLRKWLHLSPTGTQQPKSIRSTLVRSVMDLRNDGRDAVIILDGGKGDLNYTGGVVMDAEFNRDLVESIFLPGSALKQGAVILRDQKIHAIGAKFPHSEREDLPEGVGLKHRLGLGATESADVGAIIVSGQDGTLSTAYKGYLAYNISDDELERFVDGHT